VFMIFWDLIHKHLYPFLLAVIFSVGAVTILMQYMLWDELPEEDSDVANATSSILSLETLPKTHRLDVIKLSACGKGHLISVSLDRLISISLFHPSSHEYSQNVLTMTAMTPPLWPIVSIAIDDNGTWAALCTASGNVALWNLKERRLSHSIKIDLKEQYPYEFALVWVKGPERERLSLIVITPDGMVTEFDALHSTTLSSFQIGLEKLISVSVSCGKAGINIIALTRLGRLRMSANIIGEWSLPVSLEKSDPRLGPSTTEGKIKSITTIPLGCVFAAVRLRVVDLVDIQTRMLIHTFPAVLIKGQSLRLLSSPRRVCAECKSSAVHSLSLVYTDFESHSCVMRTYTISDDYNDLICLAPRLAGKKYPCKGIPSAKEYHHTVESPGSWESTSMQSVIGIRRRPDPRDSPSPAESSSSGIELNASDVNQRLQAKSRTIQRADSFTNTYSSANISEEWEVWTMSAVGEFHTLPLVEDRSQTPGEDDLFVASPGPIACLGNRSVAVGFGNRVKVMMVGNERFERDINEYQDSAHKGGARRKRPSVRKAL
jgi:hypothetical protein